jgi:hypothetical protein
MSSNVFFVIVGLGSIIVGTEDLFKRRRVFASAFERLLAIASPVSSNYHKTRVAKIRAIEMFPRPIVVSARFLLSLESRRIIGVAVLSYPPAKSRN